jgi:hypothetical protein
METSVPRRPRLPVQLRLPFTFIRPCAEPCCGVWYVVDVHVVGREDLCPDCRLVELALRSRVPYR